MKDTSQRHLSERHAESLLAERGCPGAREYGRALGDAGVCLPKPEMVSTNATGGVMRSLQVVWLSRRRQLRH